jgi:hypothetical protein
VNADLRAHCEAGVALNRAVAVAQCEGPVLRKTSEQSQAVVAATVVRACDPGRS